MGEHHFKDYTIQGWVMDEERLKKGGSILTKEYFEKQLEKIREILMDAGRVTAELAKQHLKNIE